MKEFKYQLEKYKGMNSRFVCPNCGNNRKTFVRYIDIEKNEYLGLFEDEKSASKAYEKELSLILLK